MAGAVTLTAVYELVEGGWVQVHLEELPEVITAAPTREEAEELIDDALAEYLAALDSPPVAGPDKVLVTGDVRIEARREDQTTGATAAAAQVRDKTEATRREANKQAGALKAEAKRQARAARDEAKKRASQVRSVARRASRSRRGAPRG